MTERIIEGTVLVGEDFDAIDGRVVIDDGTIVAIEAASVTSSAIICPTFVNAHTHIGDSIAKEAGAGLTLEELVAPPDGLKHELLEEASFEESVDAMTRSLRYMVRGGIGTCIDFREGGRAGIEALHQAQASVSIDAIKLGRGDPSVLTIADGYGASGAGDGSFTAARNRAREAGKVFGIHAGEVDAADINPALDLDPDFLVHMVHAESLHLERLADRAIPVVCCPRSNLVTGVGLPPIEALLEQTTVALGTDNVMLNSPSMFREMEFVAKLYDIDARSILQMATVNGARICDREEGIIAVDRPARLVIFDGDSDNLTGAADPVRAIVRRAGMADVDEVLLHPVTSQDA